MFRPLSRSVGGPLAQPRHTERKGAILLVVLTLLALFAVIGLAFVLYAESEANASRIARESVTNTVVPIDSAQLINNVFTQIVFSNDDPSSALYGYDMARMVYGTPLNTVPYNGHGIYREPLDLPYLGLPSTSATPLDRTQVLSFTPLNWYDPAKSAYTQVFIDPDLTTGNGIVRFSAPAPFGSSPANLQFHRVARNAPYTYPDRNNAYIAVQDPATGQIVLPSYHRPTLFGSLDASNQNWMTPQGKFKLLRSRTIDNLTKDEINHIFGRGLWPDVTTGGTNLTAAQYTQLATILTGQDATANAAVSTFKSLFPYPAANPDGTVTGDVQNMKFATGSQAAQNYGMQRNDSVWLDANLPIVTYRGRRLRPMVAPLMLPLDGRVNMNVAGNILGNSNTTSLSHQGFGPHEINLGAVANIAGTEMPFIIKNRYNNGGVQNTTVPSPRGSANTNTQQMFHPDALIGFYPGTVSSTNFQIYPPTYSQVNFDGNGTNTSAVYPTAATDYRSNPSYYNTGTAYGNADPTTEETLNPMMFNPYEWDYFTKGGTSAATPQIPRLVPITDMRRMEARYSDKQQYLQNYTVLASNLTNYAGTNPNNAADATRALLTPISNRLQRPGLAPNFFGSVAATGAGLSLQFDSTLNRFSYLNTPGTAGIAVPTLDVAPTSTLVTNLSTGGDVNGGPGMTVQNLRSIFGGVDINTPMPDYRDPATRPRTAAGDPDLTQVWPMNTTTVTMSSPGILGSYDRATMARQTLAKLIFDRLAIATGARVSVIAGVVKLPDPTYDGTAMAWTYALNGATVQKAEYDALRWLAQLAANIVDYIDGDDVSTPFVWNPVVGDTYPYTPSYNTTNNEIGYRVVFGVEKPRLVINEVYSEISNDQADRGNGRANNPFHVRYFIELLNPGNTEANKHSPLAGPTATDPIGAVGLQYNTYSAFQVVVHTSSSTVVPALAAPDNVLGTVQSTPPKLQMQFNSNFVTSASAPTGTPTAVEPNNGNFSVDMTANNVKRNGFCVIGPEITNPGQADPQAFTPNVSAATDPYSLMLMKKVNATQDSLDYQVPIGNANGIPAIVNQLNNPTDQGNAVLLQRLACPFIPQSATNPYVTVDYMTQVKVHDAIHSGNDNNGNHGHNPNVTQDKRWSIGRVSPFAGYQVQMNADNLNPLTTTQTFTDTLVLGQNPTPVPDPLVSNSLTNKVTFFRMNSTTGTIGSSPPPTLNTTLLAPFEWLAHLDRKVISAAELLSLSATRPQDLTHQFAIPAKVLNAGAAAGTLPTYHQQTLGNMVIPTNTTIPLPVTSINPLYRMLEVLQPKPWTRGIGAGSRTPGSVNINMLWDEGTKANSVFRALMDPQANINTFTTTDSDAIWNALKATRSPSWTSTIPVVGVTSDEVDTSGATTFDRPFKSFGVANFVGNGGVLSQTDVNSTILRLRTPTGDGKTLFSLPNGSYPNIQKNSYADLEPLRKVYNNISTTTDTYLLVFTIGYFEVIEGDAIGKTLVRREAYNQVPGDLRSQFAAVIDRSAIGLQLDVNGNPTNTFGRPWFTEVSTAAIPFNTSATTTTPNPATPAMGNTRYYFRFLANGNVNNTLNGNILLNYDGQVITLGVGSQLRIGTGVNAPIISITGLGYSDNTPAQPPGLTPPPLPAINLPSFDSQTGLATVAFDWPTAAQGPPSFVMPGQSMTGLVIPGNPGKQPGFDYTMPIYKSVVPDFSMLRPNP